MAEFVWNIRQYEANTVATYGLAIAARNELFAMAEHGRIDSTMSNAGILHVYRTKRDFDHALKVNVLLRKKEALNGAPCQTRRSIASSRRCKTTSMGNSTRIQFDR